MGAECGRLLTPSDERNHTQTVVLSYGFWNSRFGHACNVVGRTLSIKTVPFMIVGVAAPNFIGLNGDPTDIWVPLQREEPRPMAYFPYSQLEDIGGMHVELRTYGDPERLLPIVQKTLSGFAPDLTPLQPMSQKQQFELSISGDKLIARLAMFFGLLAAILVATGLYGTIAYNVSRRTSELGIRMALGAGQSQVLWMILKEGLWICAWGVLIGLPLAFAGARLLGSLLYDLKPTDPLSLIAAIAGIFLVATTACFVPALRAASISPMRALRNE